MPRNNRQTYYTRKFDMRFSKSMSDRLEQLARNRQSKLAHIVRLATEMGLRKMESAQEQEQGMALLSEGQRARVSGLSTPLTKPGQKFDGMIATVVKDDVTGWTYATYVGDGPYAIIVVKLDAQGELQGDYKLEVEVDGPEGPEWREINGAKTQA